MSRLVLWRRVVYRWWRLVMIVSAGLAPARWRGTIVSVWIVRMWRTVRGRRTGLLRMIMVGRRWRWRWRSGLVRITAAMVVLGVISWWLGRGSRGDLLLLLLRLRLLALGWWSCFWRGRLDCRRRRQSRDSTRPRKDNMRGSWLGDVITSIGDYFADLLDLLSLDLSNYAYSATFLLLWFILSLLGCMADRR
jgi:hypothetical protein